MIKNTLILILFLAVIGLSYKTLADTRNNQEIVSTFQSKIEELMRHINKAYNIAKTEARNSSTPPIGYQERKNNKNTAEKVVFVNNNAGSQPSNKVMEQVEKKEPKETTPEILNTIKPKTKEKSNFIKSEDLDSILSILKSARNLLNKTSFSFQQSREESLAEKPNSKPAIIKKKLSNGPGELG